MSEKSTSEPSVSTPSEPLKESLPSHDGAPCPRCEENTPCEDDEETMDLRYVSEHQIACSGEDLLDMLNCDEGVGPDLYVRLGLTPHIDDSLGFDYTLFAEIREEAYYMITFPEATDFGDFSVAQALSVEEITEKCFNELLTDGTEDPCDGDCESCLQDCIGKRPVE